MSNQVVEIGGKNIELLSALGQGTYGTVYLIDTSRGKKALKIITNEISDGIRSLREIDIMSKIRHPNLVKAEGIVVGVNEVSTVGILMSLAKTNLKLILTKPDFTLDQRIKILHDITLGIDHLHREGFLHLDLKPENILIFDENGIRGKITDFGISLLIDSEGVAEYPRELMTITHRSPNVMEGDRKYTAASDVWSLGIIFLEVLSGGKQLYPDYTKATVKKTVKELFNPRNIDNTLNYYLANLPEPTKKYASALIREMLRFKPKERISISKILSSPLFKFSHQNIKYPLNPKYTLPKPPRKCDIIYYYGFDLLIRLFLKFQKIKTETFFLAADIYQRALAYANKLTGDQKIDWANVSLIAVTSMYMAIKMIEPYYPDQKELTKLADNVFNYLDIPKVEAALVQLFDGIVYNKNLFTETEGQQRLIQSFESLRNCHLYSKIDLKKWKEMNPKINNFDKHISFNTFFRMTPTREVMIKELKEKYIPRYYQVDLR